MKIFTENFDGEEKSPNANRTPQKASGRQELSIIDTGKLIAYPSSNFAIDGNTF